MFPYLRLAVGFSFSLLFSLSASGSPLLYKREQQCNGHAELCNRKYGNTTFLGSHDSFAISGNPLALARNQEVDLEAQLKLGVRALQVQAHMDNDEIHLCHTSCALFDGGTAENYLVKVKRFLDGNPNEVLTIIIANKADISSKTFRAVFDKIGMNSMSYVPPQPVISRDDWPTLGDMISTGKRVVTFLDTAAEGSTTTTTTTTNSTASPEVADFILPEFKMVWEDEMDPTNIKFPCKIDRTAGPLAPSQQLNLINHNLNTHVIPFGPGPLVPDRLNSPRTNGLELIMEHVANCAPLADGGNPNFVLLDYVSVGQGVLAVDKLNGL